VFVPDKLFHPSLMFAGKAVAYLNEDPFWCSSLHRVGSRAFPQTLV